MKLNYPTLLHNIAKEKSTKSCISAILMDNVLTRITSLSIVMLFLFSGNQVFSQIIVESGTANCDFGTDADSQAGITSFIYAGGILQPSNAHPASDDWFEDGPTGGEPARGVLDVSGPGPSGNNPYLAGMSQPAFSEIDGKLWLDAVYLRDPNWAGNNVDFSIFKTGSNKNADNPASWTITTGSNPQKNDIIDVFGHLRRDGVTVNDDLWAMVGASTRSADGASYLDIELYRSMLIYNTATNTLSGLGPDGGHTAWDFTETPAWEITQLGDVIIALNFENGGTNIIGHIYIWVKPSDLPGGSIPAANLLIPNNFNFRFAIGGNGQPIFESGDQADGWGYAEIELNGIFTGQTVAFASINADDVPAGPFGTLFGPQATQTNIYKEDSFVEFGLNLTGIGLDQSTVGGGECGALFGGVLIKTRSSASFTSELKDLAGPFPFGDLEEVSVTIEGGDIPCGSTDPITLTAVTATNCNGCTFAWYDGNPTDPNSMLLGEESTLEVSEPGTYWVVVTAPGINGPGTGCSSQDDILVDQLDPETLVVSCPGEPVIVSCTDDISTAFSAWLADFSVSGGGGVVTQTYTVDGGDSIDFSLFPQDIVAPSDVCAGGSVTVVLSASDECLQSESCSSTFTLSPITPGITAPDDESSTVECPADAVDPGAPATVQDACGRDVVPVYVGVTSDPNPVTCEGTVEYKWSYTDCTGEVTDYYTYTYTIEYEDFEANMPADDSADVQCPEDAEVVPTPPVVEDNCGNVITPTGPEVVTTPDPIICIGTVTYTWNYEDCEGNSHDWVFTYNVEDTTVPEITVPVVEPLCNDPFPASLNATWTDNCAEGGTVNSGSPVISNFECHQEAVYTFYVEDNCENSATETVTLTREFDMYENCETAFGRLSPDNPPSQCFLDDPDYTFNRWGWTNYISTEDTYVLDLYAGAAHCDTANGDYVGTATVTYSNGLVSVEYQLIGNYVMSEAHINISCEKYAEDSNGNPTVAPGQYTHNLGTLDHVQNYTLEDVAVTGPFWIIVHAKTCEATCSCSISTDEGGSQTSILDPIDCTLDPSIVETGIDWNVDFTVYPMPFDEEFFVDYKFEYDTDVRIQVFNVRGVLLKEINNLNYVKGSTVKANVDLKGLISSEILFVKLKSDYGIAIKKVIASKYN